MSSVSTNHLCPFLRHSTRPKQRGRHARSVYTSATCHCFTYAINLDVNTSRTTSRISLTRRQHNRPLQKRLYNNNNTGSTSCEGSGMYASGQHYRRARDSLCHLPQVCFLYRVGQLHHDQQPVCLWHNLQHSPLALTTGSQQRHRHFLLAPISSRSCCNMRQCYRAGQGARRQRSVVGAPQHDHYRRLPNAAPRRANNTCPADAGIARGMRICCGYRFSRQGAGYMRLMLAFVRNCRRATASTRQR